MIRAVRIRASALTKQVKALLCLAGERKAREAVGGCGIAPSKEAEEIAAEKSKPPSVQKPPWWKFWRR
jgi:hypothetical protein